MKKNYLYLIWLVPFTQTISAQNVGIGTTTPVSKLHIKGAVNVSQFIIDAHSTQSNTNPLIKLRKSNGSDLMWIHSDDINNSFIGLVAGGNNNAAGGGIFNTFCGSFTGGGNTTGSSNTTLGAYAFANNKTGSYNTAIGTYSLYQNLGTSNTAIGMNALASNGIGNYNSAIGHEALYSNSIGGANTANGYRALYSNTSASFNTATGYFALYSNTIGYQNIANGEAALYANTTASENVAIGGSALALQSFSNGGGVWVSGNVAIGEHTLYSNQPTSTSEGIYNTAVGHLALTTNTTGAYNTGTGAKALYSNSTGVANTAIGYQALYSNSIGFNNTANGYGALYSNNTGYANTANGYLALNSNNSGYDNTANGEFALFSNTTAFQNTAIGIRALNATTTGAYNTACGANALKNNIGGYQNIAIGFNSGTHSSTPNIYNTISIGNDGYLNAYQNQAMIGNLSTIWTGGNTTWFTYASDARVKNNVAEDVKGLDFISRLRPVTYNLDIKAMRVITGNEETVEYPEKYDVEKIKQSGFLAQEVEQAAKESGYSFNGITIPKNGKELYTMSYSLFVVPLVKAVQELAAKADSQQAFIEEQNKKIELLLKEIQQIKDKLK